VTTEPIGVLVMAYGTPADRTDVGPYYTRIRHGRPPSDEQLDDLVRRYDAIGGLSPLATRTDAQVRALAAELARRAPGRFDVRLGTKYGAPSIEETVAGFAGDGVRRVIGLVLAPHGSSMSTGEYFTRARAALGDTPLVSIPHWYESPGFAELLADRVHEAYATLPAERQADALLVFTAHSLPARIVAEGDTYPEQLRDSAAAVAAAVGVDRFEVAWQSAARTPEPWLGPDILEVIAGLPDRGVHSVVICPIGFVSDHLEVLYDLDVAAQDVAANHEVAMTRTRSLDDDPAFVALLASIVEGAA
jgi:ferrochelatase